MIEDRIQTIEARLRDSSNIPDSVEAELLKLLAALKEGCTLAESHEEDAQSITKFLLMPAYHKTKKTEAGRIAEWIDRIGRIFRGLSIRNWLKRSNQIAVVLSNMGI